MVPGMHHCIPRSGGLDPGPVPDGYRLSEPLLSVQVRPVNEADHTTLAELPLEVLRKVDLGDTPPAQGSVPPRFWKKPELRCL